MTVRAYGEGQGNNRCHVCGEVGHYRAECKRTEREATATVAQTGGTRWNETNPAAAAPPVANARTTTVARPVGGGGADAATAFPHEPTGWRRAAGDAGIAIATTTRHHHPHRPQLLQQQRQCMPSLRRATPPHQLGLPPRGGKYAGDYVLIQN